MNGVFISKFKHGACVRRPPAVLHRAHRPPTAVRHVRSRGGHPAAARHNAAAAPPQRRVLQTPRARTLRNRSSGGGGKGTGAGASWRRWRSRSSDNAPHSLTSKAREAEGGGGSTHRSRRRGRSLLVEGGAVRPHPYASLLPRKAASGAARALLQRAVPLPPQPQRAPYCSTPYRCPLP